MAIVLLQPDGVPITAQQERQGSAALYGGGANRPLGGRSGFRADTPANVLTVTTTTWTLLPCSIMIDPGAATHQGMYGWASDANITGTPTPPDAALPRKDIYYIQVNDSTSGDGSGAVNANVYYTAGTPNATPTAPVPPARSFLLATVTVPQVGGGSPTVSMNPYRFAAAGAPLPVYSQTERDVLVAYDGLIVQRRDLIGAPLETRKSGAWYRQAGSVESALAVSDGNFTITGGLVKTVTDGLTQVTASLQMVRSNAIGTTVSPAGNTIIIGAIPAGFRPPGNFSMIASVLTDADARYAEIQLIVNNGGSIVGRSVSGGDITISQNYKLYITGSWFI